MKKLHLLLLSTLLLSACDTVPVHRSVVPAAASHAALDAQFAKVATGVASGSGSITMAQRQAAALERKIHDPAIARQITDLKSSLSTAQAQLSGVTADLTTFRATLTWYEGAANDAWTGWKQTADQLDAAVAYGKSEHKARVDADRRADVVIYAFALWVAIVAARIWGATFGAFLKSVPVPFIAAAAVAAPFIVGFLAFCAAYAFAYYGLTWLGQFLPDFSGLIPSIKELFHKL